METRRRWREVEDQGTYKGYTWTVLFLHPLGCRCGYVQVPDSLAEYENEVVSLSVHGGVTYLEYLNPIDHTPSPHLWVGFDCYHWNNKPFYPSDECHSMIDRLLELESKVEG